MNAPFNPNNPDNLPVHLHKFKSELWLQIEDRINLLKGNKERIKQHIKVLEHSNRGLRGHITKLRQKVAALQEQKEP